MARSVALGEVLWDLLPGGRRLGGAPANVAGHLAQLGVESSVVTAVGDDDDGRRIVRELGESGVRVEGVSVLHGFPTGTAGVVLDEDGTPTFSIHWPAAWDAVPASEAALGLVRAADAVIFGTLAQRDERTRHTILSLLDEVPSRCLRVLDVNLRAPYVDRAIILASLVRAVVVKLSDSELPLIAGMLGVEPDERRVFNSLSGLKLLICTRGAHGSRLISETRDIVHPGCPVEVVDGVGAGDAFTATVIHGLLSGLELELISERANRVASYVCTQSGAVPRLPSGLL
jgi:fructokinase